MILATDLQMVIDRLLAIYEVDLSPQIMRSAVDYAKRQAMSVYDEADDTGGKTPLMLRTQGYIEGYCHVYDSYVNRELCDITENDAIDDVMYVLSNDYGESLPTWVFASCADFIAGIAAKSSADAPKGEVSRVLSHCGHGYIEGADDALADMLMHRHIRAMSELYPIEAGDIAYEIVVEETEMELADDKAAELLQECAVGGLCDMMNKLVVPKSGNSLITTDDPLLCAMLYILGFMNGMFDIGEEEAQDKDEIDAFGEQSLRSGEGDVRYWCRYKGYGSDIVEKSLSRMQRKVLLEDKENEEGDVLEENDGTMAALFAIGVADGAAIMSDDDKKNTSLDQGLLAELDEVLTNAEEGL